ncbi:hypothetical protein GMDG_05875 [Pseudogymnoascus destructans 20631-21]|uniref:Uncharacterized protein n=1 Tax=Pseudogymnoascus destructans (strain ATCC MYA-4855 / 20631-21) TaxID=658429 RepID=L8FR54_PSED2|nr:hypothetical protein GMDG_05875 [Pseudogymnoascus destructans 20631-21]
MARDAQGHVIRDRSQDQGQETQSTTSNEDCLESHTYNRRETLLDDPERQATLCIWELKDLFSSSYFNFNNNSNCERPPSEDLTIIIQPTRSQITLLEDAGSTSSRSPVSRFPCALSALPSGQSSRSPGARLRLVFFIVKLPWSLDKEYRALLAAEAALPVVAADIVAAAADANRVALVAAQSVPKFHSAAERDSYEEARATRAAIEEGKSSRLCIVFGGVFAWVRFDPSSLMVVAA